MTFTLTFLFLICILLPLLILYLLLPNFLSRFLTRLTGQTWNVNSVQFWPPGRIRIKGAHGGKGSKMFSVGVVEAGFRVRKGEGTGQWFMFRISDMHVTLSEKTSNGGQSNEGNNNLLDLIFKIFSYQSLLLTLVKLVCIELEDFKISKRMKNGTVLTGSWKNLDAFSAQDVKNNRKEITIRGQDLTLDWSSNGHTMATAQIALFLGQIKEDKSFEVNDFNCDFHWKFDSIKTTHLAPIRLSTDKYRFWMEDFKKTEKMKLNIKQFSSAFADRLTPDVSVKGLSVVHGKAFEAHLQNFHFTKEDNNAKVIHLWNFYSSVSYSFLGSNLYSFSVREAYLALPLNELVISEVLWSGFDLSQDKESDKIFVLKNFNYHKSEKSLEVRDVAFQPRKCDVKALNKVAQNVPTSERSSKEKKSRLPSVKVNISNLFIHLFYDKEFEMDIETSVGNIMIDSTAHNSNVVFTVTELRIMEQNLKTILLEGIDQIHLVKQEEILQISLKGFAQIHWFPHVHKHVTNWIEDLELNWTEFKSVKNNKTENKEEKLQVIALSQDVRITLYCDKTVCAFHFNSLAFSKNVDSLWRVKIPLLSAGFNQYPKIIQFETVTMAYFKNQSKARIDMDHKSDLKNDCIEVTLASCSVVFPYEVDIHKALSGDIVGHIKWVKTLHKISSDEPKTNKVAPDVTIFAKSLTFELPDDSFEVRLRDNYELMEDEYYESEKRRQCLAQKIEELRLSNVILPTSKIEELYASLSKKNADLYIQRMKCLRKNAKPRTRLMEVSFTAIKLYVLSDSSLTGNENVRNFIKEVEKDSLLPDSLELSSSYLKWLTFECKSALFRLRDFTQPLIEMNHVLLWGRLALAEQVSIERETRVQRIPMKHKHIEDEEVRRGLQSLKLFSDLAMDMSYYVFSHGPCWEPVISQVSLTLNYITGVKKADPSPPLSWWDKLRYLCHGRLFWSVKVLKLFMHTSLDPYNTTEEVELTLKNGNLQFLHNSVLKCDAASLDLYVRTASKYDDCKLLHIPNVSLNFEFDWICIGNPQDHYGVVLCTERHLKSLTSLSSTLHDSYKRFRSSAVNLRIHLGSNSHKTPNDKVLLHMFSSTIRWMESLKWLFSGTSRPIRRGKLFTENDVKKKSFFRHLQQVEISQNFNKSLELDYWTSAAMNRGILMRITGGLFIDGKYSLKLVNVQDDLIHRPRSQWQNHFTNCKLDNTDVWFQCSDQDQEGYVEKKFFFSVDRIRYDRESQNKEGPMHKLTVNGAKCAWTISNRDMTFSLYESWWRAHILREQLSTEALKSIKRQVTCQNQEELLTDKSVKRSPSTESANNNNTTLSDKKMTSNSGELSLSTLTTWKGNDFVDEMLEGSNFATVFEREESYTSNNMVQETHQAMISSLKEDVLRKNWLIKFINCQVLLKGSETMGHLILSASKAEAKKTIHHPVWKGDTLLSKSSWSGSLEDMQYHATVSPMDDNDGKFMSWLPTDVSENKSTDFESSGYGFGTVGGVVSGKLAGSEEDDDIDNRQHQQLQRIVSKCRCEFYYVFFGDEALENIIGDAPFTRRPPPEEQMWTESSSQKLVNSFSLVHHDLNVSTNSLQYSVILDVINNLLLYLDPTILNRTENYLRMKYKLMLSNIEDQKKPIAHLQSSLRQLICQLRSKEKELYHLRTVVQSHDNLTDLERDIQSLKEMVAYESEELNVRLRCFHDFQLSQEQKYTRPLGENKEEMRQKSHIFFSRAQWRLTETDGQLGIADVSIGNFSYTKSIMKDDSTEHLLEMGHVQVKNLLKEQMFVDVLLPTELQNVPLDRQRTLRVFCREKAPVGGISVKDHFEVNVVPLTIGITAQFYKKIMAFCFPDRTSELQFSSSKRSSTSSTLTSSHKKSSSFYVESPLRADDVEQMKERAKLNKLFVYIKIPEVPICVSFKGEKEKNKILDVANFLLQVPTIEYHNVTWTWLDFLMAVKSKTKDSLISQAIKQKFLKSASTKFEVKKPMQDDEEKAKLLFGNVLMNPHNKKK